MLHNRIGYIIPHYISKRIDTEYYLLHSKQYNMFLNLKIYVCYVLYRYIMLYYA